MTEYEIVYELESPEEVMAPGFRNRKTNTYPPILLGSRYFQKETLQTQQEVNGLNPGLTLVWSERLKQVAS